MNPVQIARVILEDEDDPKDYALATFKSRVLPGASKGDYRVMRRGKMIGWLFHRKDGWHAWPKIAENWPTRANALFQTREEAKSHVEKHAQ